MFDNQPNPIKPPSQSLTPIQRRPLKSFGWLISTCFTLFKQHAGKLTSLTGLFVGIALGFGIIGFVILAASSINLQNPQQFQNSLSTMAGITFIMAYIIFILLQALNKLLLQTALILRIYRLETKESLKNIIKCGFKKILPLVGVKLLTGLITSAPLIITLMFYSITVSPLMPRASLTTIYITKIILGILSLSALVYLVWTSVRLFPASYLVLTQDQKISESIKESWRLTSGYWWSIFYRLFLFLLLSVVGLIVINLIPLLGALASILIIPSLSTLFIFLIYQNLKLIQS